ncbi:hypothetical protein L0Y46_02685 [bacterium]|nr:hypothetical protein [bacterium]
MATIEKNDAVELAGKDHILNKHITDIYENMRIDIEQGRPPSSLTDLREHLESGINLKEYQTALVMLIEQLLQMGSDIGNVAKILKESKEITSLSDLGAYADKFIRDFKDAITQTNTNIAAIRTKYQPLDTEAAFFLFEFCQGRFSLDDFTNALGARAICDAQKIAEIKKDKNLGALEGPDAERLTQALTKIEGRDTRDRDLQKAVFAILGTGALQNLAERVRTHPNEELRQKFIESLEKHRAYLLEGRESDQKQNAERSIKLLGTDYLTKSAG